MLDLIATERDCVLVIYSKLAVSDGDHQWIEGIRQAHDPQHQMVAAHFTFVFPFAGTPVDDAIAHAARVSEATASIHFRLTEAAVVKDALGPATHVFLLPTVGAHRMRELHGQLYSGVLASHLHSSIPFSPHVTVGAFEQEADAASAANHLGEFNIPGVLEGLFVAKFDGRVVVDLCELPFAN
jgi:2'-5' RNA ligase